jgi:hypothetical protein
MELLSRKMLLASCLPRCENHEPRGDALLDDMMKIMMMIPVRWDLLERAKESILLCRLAKIDLVQTISARRTTPTSTLLQLKVR